MVAHTFSPTTWQRLADLCEFEDIHGYIYIYNFLGQPGLYRETLFPRRKKGRNLIVITYFQKLSTNSIPDVAHDPCCSFFKESTEVREFWSIMSVYLQVAFEVEVWGLSSFPMEVLLIAFLWWYF